MIKRPLGLGCLAVVLLLCIYVNLVDAGKLYKK